MANGGGGQPKNPLSSKKIGKPPLSGEAGPPIHPVAIPVHINL